MAFSNSKPFRIGVTLLRLALGGIFIYAAYVKLAEPWQLFSAGIRSYEILPDPLADLLARTLPWFELLVGILLVVGRWLRFSSVTMSALLMVFFSLMVRAAVKGQTIECGCFGPGETISWKTLLRDGSMLAGSLLLTLVAFVNRRKPAATA